MDIKVFTDDIEETAKNQLDELCNQSTFTNCKIRIMPDVHAGAGCVIGFTSNMEDRVIPNLIGVDIGCGMSVYNLGDINIDFTCLDNFIKENIPCGLEVNKNPQEYAKGVINLLYCSSYLHDRDRLDCSLGTLGGGNHFIEIDKDKYNNKYLVIHSGSRNLGYQVATFYQNKAIKNLKEISSCDINSIVDSLKKEGRQNEINITLKDLKQEHANNMPPEALCYVENKDKEYYMHDMRLCQEFAKANRLNMINKILSFFNIKFDRPHFFETIHNYIDDNNIIRKGAVSAHKGETLIIPMNMRDGCLICQGKGNPDWNESAPHGAGRVMSRAKARNTLKLEEFTNSMSGIYTTTATEDTIDEAPMVYKPMEEIIKNITPTVDILYTIKPIYNFKAAEKKFK